jgi:hypothetical protein
MMDRTPFDVPPQLLESQRSGGRYCSFPPYEEGRGVSGRDIHRNSALWAVCGLISRYRLRSSCEKGQ